jgi:hypothetical protein
MVIAFTARNFRFIYSTHLGVMCHPFTRCAAAMLDARLWRDGFRYSKMDFLIYWSRSANCCPSTWMH